MKIMIKVRKESQMKSTNHKVSNNKHEDNNIKILIVLAIIITIGIFVRVWNIDKESYWVDEAIGVGYAQEDYSKMYYDIQKDIHPPLHTLILYSWVRLFGTSPESTRAVSVIFGTLATGIAFLIGKKLFNYKTGTIFAAFIALSPLLIYYSQETRSYSLMVFLTLISFYFYAKFIEKTSLSNIVLYILTTVALLYTHVFSVLIVLIQNIFYAYLKKEEIKKIFHKNHAQELKKWIITQIIIIGLFIPWILVILKQMKYAYYTSWIQVPSGGVIAGTLKEFFGNFFIMSVFFLLVIYFILEYFYPNKVKFVQKKDNKDKSEYLKINITNKDKNNIILIGIWLLIPFSIVLIYSWIFHSFYQTRYMLFTLPALYLFFSLMIVRFIEDTHIKKYIKYLMITSIIIASLVSIYIQSTTLQKDDWKGITAYLNQNVNKSDIIFIHPYYQQNAFAYYYEKSCFGAVDAYNCMSYKKDVFSIDWKENCCNDTSSLTTTLMKNNLEDYLDKNIWLVSVRPEVSYGNDELYTYLSEHKKLVSIKEFTKDIKVYKFE